MSGWIHKCSLDWLKARQRYITASDVKSLLPVTPTGRPRAVSDKDYMRVMAGKMTQLTEEDCMSYGAAARGHLLEPYAVDSLNKILAELQGKEHETFYWWDDKLIAEKGRVLAFSPDAMNVPMDDPNAKENVTAIAEIKSYGSEKHLTTAYTPKEEIEERWQIASAMALLPNIDHAYLVLYNPKMKFRKTFVIRYDRDDLLSEIAMICKVEDDWDEFRKGGAFTKKPPAGFIWSYHGGNEESIKREIDHNESVLNPV